MHSTVAVPYLFGDPIIFIINPHAMVSVHQHDKMVAKFEPLVECPSV